MKIFWKVIVAVIAFSLLGIMIVLGTAYIKSVERHTYLADNKVLSDKYVYEEFSNGKKRVKNRATQQVILDRLEWLVTGDKADSLAVFCRKGKRGYLNCYTGEVVIPAQYERAWVFSTGKDGQLSRRPGAIRSVVRRWIICLKEAIVPSSTMPGNVV